MHSFSDFISSLFPAGFNLAGTAKFLLIFAATVLILCFLVKFIFGKESHLNRSIAGAIGILFIYAVTAVIYTFNPGDLANYLPPLPYVIFSGNKLYLFVFEGTKFSVICAQALSMVILAFLYHLLDDFMPKGKGLNWLLYRLLTVLMAIALHYVATWLVNNYLPGAMVTYAPTVLLVILLGLLLLGTLKLVLGVVLTVMNPILGALYAFFFSSKLGRQLSRAVLTTLLLSILVIVLQVLGYGVLSVATGDLITYIPLLIILLGLWYFLGLL